MFGNRVHLFILHVFSMSALRILENENTAMCDIPFVQQKLHISALNGWGGGGGLHLARMLTDTKSLNIT